MITVLLDAATADKLDATAAALGEPVTRIAATAIGQWLAKR
jgi:predicted transcriptional regulator